jgi:DNA polymerase III delta prime subunit
MQALNQTQLNLDIATIQLLHGRLGLDLATSLSFGTGNFMFLNLLNKRNILISKYKDLLYKFQVIGDSVPTEYYNILTVDDIQNIIDDAYRELEKYNY